MRARLRVWLSNIGQALRKYWWAWFSLAIGALLRDRVTSGVNRWLDDNAPPIISSLWNNMTFLPQSELGIVAWLFVITILSIMILSYVDTWRIPYDGHKAPSLPLSPRDEANRERIARLYWQHGDPAYSDMQQLTNRLCYRLTNDEGRDLQDPLIAELAGNYAFGPCNYADGAMRRALNGPEPLAIGELQQRLLEFVKAYKIHVRCMHKIAPFVMPPQLNEDPGYPVWQEKHRLFRQELRGLAATDDFVHLRQEIAGAWHDTWGVDE